MQWSDEGIVLGARRHGESSVILELMTRAHGRHLGLVHGGRSKRLQPVLQAGNTVRAVWRARLDEQLGAYAVEGDALRSARFIGSGLALYGVATLSALLRLLPERDPHPALYERATALADHLDEPVIAPALLIRFELEILADFGFGLDLASCAASGATDDLVYVSPRSGRAVSREAGEPYRDRLFGLPGFLGGDPAAIPPSLADIRAGFVLTDFFLRQHVFEPRGMEPPGARERFVALALREDG